MTEKDLITDLTVHLLAAISLLESYHYSAAFSKKHALFNTMISDYKKSAENGRTYMKGVK